MGSSPNAFVRPLLAAMGVAALGLLTPAVAKEPKPPVTNSSTSFPATGQTTKYAAGDDGDIRAGLPPSFTDNGNGTITDEVTGLMWEAKTSCDDSISSSAHDGDNVFPWAGLCATSGAFCGTDADCPNGELCEAKAGRCDQTGGFCRTTADCPNFETCWGGEGICSITRDGCTYIGDCEWDEGEVCENARGVCQNGGSACLDDQDCNSGGSCLPVDSTIFQWVATLNAQSFAGYRDWRIPNVKELESLVDYGTHNPAVPPLFRSGSSSCTKPQSVFWRQPGFFSSTTWAAYSFDGAFSVEFFDGEVTRASKLDLLHVRAVRGGRGSATSP